MNEPKGVYIGREQHVAMSMSELAEYANSMRPRNHGSGIHSRPAHESIGEVAMLGDIDRIERWMQWKSGKAVVERAQAKLDAAVKRRQKGTNLTLADVAELIAMVNIGGEPK